MDIDRRNALRLMAGVGLVSLTRCATGGSDNAANDSAATTTSQPASTPSTTTNEDTSCTTIPQETAGPFPGDGSNGPNVLTADGVVRSDIRSSFGGSSGTAQGVPLDIKLTIVDDAACKAFAGAAVYLWHCDREGRYSLYSQGVTNQNYLRGVQQAGADGTVTFKSIFPAAYSGRWPHIHFEVYPSLDAARSAKSKLATSQVALPEGVCRQVFATSGYEQSVPNMARTSLSRDMVFGDDDGVHQMGTVTGAVASGLTVALTVPV
jgi:protocatechuate 3,4-dioxygenase beta subunit